MIKLLIFLLICYGASNQLVYNDGPFKIWYYLRLVAGKISSGLGELFNCMICLPTWIGIILSALNIWLIPELSLTPGMLLLSGKLWWLILIIDGAVASGGVWLIHTIQEWFERGNNGDENEINDKTLLNG